MNKFFASVAIVALFLSAVGIVAVNSSSSWEPVNIQSEDVVGGGGCYVFTVSLCPGGSSTCGQTLCSSSDGGASWTCNVAEVQRRQRAEFGGTYNSGYRDVADMDGWNSYSSSEIICTIVYACVQTCVQDESTNQWRCGGNDYATFIDRTHYQGAGGYCP